MKRVTILAALALMLFPASSNGDDLLLEWSGYLQEGALQEAVKLHLEERGIRPTVLRGGIKYTSKIKTPQRDYLFCNGRLASMVEGERVTGEGSTTGCLPCLRHIKKYGDPTAVKYEHTWRQIMFQWKLPGGTTLYLLVRGAPPDIIIWSRELVHEPSNRSCK